LIHFYKRFIKYKMPPKKAKKTASGYRMPDHLPPGTSLTDLNKKQWVLGQSVGTGGFGEIYLATEGGKGEQRVVKIEPHENGPLFVEMHFYISAGKPEHIQEWKKARSVKDIPHLPMLRGHGSYQHKGTDTYRFLVIDRLGKDLDKTFKNGANVLSMSTVASVTVQVVTALEYIHYKGYTHNDVKAANLLLGVGDGGKDVYLVDFGLCVKYMKGGQEGTHKEYKADPRKAHDGTIEYLSRDAHIGCTSRRSDMEVLGFNIIHWLTGSLPWISLTANPAKVQSAKEQFMKDIRKNTANMPTQVQEFMKYVAGLKFDEKPDYDKLRGLFMAEVKKSGGKLDLDACDEVSAMKRNGKSVPKKVNGLNGKENDLSPVKKARKINAKKAPVTESDSEEELEPSPIPAKKAKKAPVRKVAKKPVVESSEEGSEDMFDTPSPKKKVARNFPKYQEAACQTSPAFVAAARAAKKGLAPADLAKVNVESPARARSTPVRSKASVEQNEKKVRNTPTRGSNTPSKSKSTEQNVVSIPGMSNPTPAMLEIMQKKLQAEQDKTKNKRKKK